MIKCNPITLAFTVVMTALLNGCNAASYAPLKSEHTGTVVEQKKIQTAILDENAAKEKLNSIIWLDFALATFRDNAMLM